MRALVYVSLIALASAGSADAGAPTHLYASRGFAPGQCYRHPAIRRCKAGEGKPCMLEVFPGRSAGLLFPLGVEDRLLPAKESTDYGIFLFKVESYDGKFVPKTKVLDVERVELARWDGVQGAGALGRPAPCR